MKKINFSKMTDEEKKEYFESLKKMMSNEKEYFHSTKDLVRKKND
jgi:hypothetical protein